MLSFFDVLITVGALMLMMIPGFVLAKTRIFGKGAGEALSGLVLYGCQPMLMIMGFQKTSFSPQIAVNMLMVLGLAFAVHFVMIAFVMLAFRNKDKNPAVNCLRFASVFANVGYMGLPFLQMLFSGTPMLGEILIYAAVVIGVFNILNWSVGIYMITGDKKYVSFKKAFLNPTVIAVFIGLIIFLIARIPLVDVATEGTAADKILTAIMKSINFLADMVTPLAMIVIGVRLANVKIKTLFFNKWAYITALNKLVLMPVVAMLIVSFLPIDVAIKYAVFFTLSMPSATSTVLFAVNFGGDGDSASVIVLLSTILSVLAIPLMFLVFTGIFGVVI